MGYEKIYRGLRVLSVEQMVALPYATWRLAAEGAEVLRVEPPVGDPSRTTGKRILDEDNYNAYFVNVNTAKKSITLNLKEPEGIDILGRLIEQWEPDVFATNQLPHNYQRLGIDHQRISRIRPDIVWVGVSGFGPDRSEAAYDPIIQAYSGFADTNGDPCSPPLKCGVSITDLETANQVYSEIGKALLHRERTGEGSRIDISMLQVTMSLLALHIPIASMGIPIPKSGNSHPQFAPVNMYPTADGHVFMALGNDSQFAALASLEGFEELQQPKWAQNNDRRADIDNLDATINRLFSTHRSEELVSLLRKRRVPVATATSLEGIFQDTYLSKHLIPARDTVSGMEARNAPLPVGRPAEEPLPFPPRFKEHNREFLKPLGLDMKDLERRGII